MTREPKKFVNLHGHDFNSLGDAIGTTQDHIDFAISNGLNGISITNHGNMNSFAPAFFYNQSLKKKGIDFKTIIGNEFYFIDSLETWSNQYREHKEKKAHEKTLGKAVQNQSKVNHSMIIDSIGNEFKNIKDDILQINDEDISSVMENEEETKQYKKYQNPIKQRNHLVLLPKNKEGLYTLFKLTSESYINGFYLYPRIDFNLIKKYANNNIIASQACIGGRLAKIVFDNQIKPYEQWGLNSIHDNENVIQQEIKNYVDMFVDALGGNKENYYLELQFNSLPQQHLVNYHFIQAHKKHGIPIVATCDSHYHNPNVWKEREIYKLMAYSTKMKGDVDSTKIPQKIEELKCNLYPKNAEQMWKSYKDYKEHYDFYDDNVVCDAIEKSYDVAHQQIESNIIESIDTKVKLPRITSLISQDKVKKYLSDDKFKDYDLETQEEKIAFSELKTKAIEGLVLRKKHNNQEYIERVKTELEVVKHLKLSKYFITYQKIMEIIQLEMLSGVARGSAAGSCLAYVLNITQVDPIKYGLLFERFLSKKKACLNTETYVVSSRGIKKIKDLNIGDFVLGETEELKNGFIEVTNKTTEKHHETIQFYIDGQETPIECSPNHKCIILRNNKRIEVMANECREEDEFIKIL